MRKLPSIIILVLCSCAQPQAGKMNEQPLNTTLNGSVGSDILTIRKQKDLPNAFGGADIFGRKVDAGATELKYAGLNSKGHAVFTVSDYNRYSNETTMSRSGMSFTNATATSYGDNQVVVHGTSTRAPQESNYISSQNGTLFTVDVKKDGGFDFGEYRVEVKSANKSSITYKLHPK